MRPGFAQPGPDGAQEPAPTGWARFDRPPRPLELNLLIGGILVFLGCLLVALLPLVALNPPPGGGTLVVALYIIAYLTIRIGFLFAFYGLAVRLALRR